VVFRFIVLRQEWSASASAAIAIAVGFSFILKASLGRIAL
jgi:hypothetical protein